MTSPFILVLLYGRFYSASVWPPESQFSAKRVGAYEPAFHTLTLSVPTGDERRDIPSSLWLRRRLPGSYP